MPENIHQTYKLIFSTPNGQMILKDLEKLFFFHKSTHVPGDPNTSAYKEGQRSVILAIHAFIERGERVEPETTVETGEADNSAGPKSRKP